jgi:protein gp37
MADQKNGISYLQPNGKTWNVALGCSPVSAGCANCWAKGMVRRIEAAQDSSHATVTCTGQWNGEICLRPDWLSKPLHWRKPLVILVQTLGDLFHEGVPFSYVAAVYGVMAACPQHTFLVLTKRPERMRAFYEWLDRQPPVREPLLECNHQALQAEIEFGEDSQPLAMKYCADPDGPWPPPNVWAGISAEDQATLDERWDALGNVAAARYWLSLEPMLGPITELSASTGMFPGFTAVGCETGTSARPCDVEWIRSVVRQCQDAHVPVHVKAVPILTANRNIGISHNPLEWPEDLRGRDEVPRG